MPTCPIFAGPVTYIGIQSVFCLFVCLFVCLLFVHILCFEIYYNFVCIVLLFVMGY